MINLQRLMYNFARKFCPIVAAATTARTVSLVEAISAFQMWYGIF